MKRTTFIALWCIGCLIGLAAGRQWLLPVWLLGSLPAWLIWRHVWLIWFLVGLSIGWWRGAVFHQRLMPYERLYGKQLTVRVTARTDGTYADGGNLAFDGGSVDVIEPSIGQLPGILKLETIGVPAVFRGDRVALRGKLYPAGGSKQGSIKFAQGSVIERHLNQLERIRLRFGAALQTVLPEPQASFGLGILVGQRSTLPPAVGEQLSVVGLTHIIAVSGYNLTIIIRFLGKRLGRSKYQTLLISSTLIIGFILITGFSASIVRAGIVSMLSLGAWYYGRVFGPVLVLLLAAVSTALWYPIYIWSDIGWYLSFLAFFGVLIVAPLITTKFWHDREPRGLMPLVIESGSAQIMAVPLILFIFGEASLVALPANLLVVPLVPLAMLLTFVGGLTGCVWPILGAWVAWPAKLLMGYMLQMADWLSRTPHAVMEYKLPVWALVGGYALLASMCWHWWMKLRPVYGKITDEGEQN